MEAYLQSSISKLKQRNQHESQPYQSICDGYVKLWNENRMLEQQHLELRRQIAIIQSETVGIMNAENGGDSSISIDKLKYRLQKIFDDLKDKNKETDSAKQQRADLGRKVSEQSKLILNIQEELHIAKSELTTCREKISTLSTNIELSQRREVCIREEIESLRGVVSTAEAKTRLLESENATLVDRIIIEKEKVVSEMNNMNKSAEVTKTTSSFFGLFGGGTQNSSKDDVVRRTSVSNNDNDTDYVSITADNSFNMLSSYDCNAIPTVAWNTIDCSISNRAFSSGKSKSTSSSSTSTSPSSSNNAIVEINDMDLVNNDTYVAVAGSDSTISLYDAKTPRGKPAAQFASKNSPILSLSSKGGEFIIGGYTDKSCRVWSSKTSKMVAQLSGHNAKVNCVKWIGSSSGYSNASNTHINEKAISVSSDRTIRVWDITTSRSIVNIQTTSAINSVDITTDGNNCITGHQDGRVRYWSILSGQCVGELLKPHSNSITSVSFGANGTDFSTAFACSRDNTISVIDSYTYDTLQTLKGDAVRSFKVTCDWSKATFTNNSNSHIACGSQDGSIFIWNTLNGEITTRLDKTEHQQPVIATVWSRLGLYTSDKRGKVILWR